MNIGKQVGLVIDWAQDRGILDGATNHSLLTKLLEECGEIARAVARGEDLEDAIGDAAIVLIILAARNKLFFSDCLDAAYNEIKDRKGQMRDGIFVKVNE